MFMQKTHEGSECRVEEVIIREIVDGQAAKSEKWEISANNLYDIKVYKIHFCDEECVDYGPAEFCLSAHCKK